jgi:isopenicillin-N N-acyltransferase like protein
MASAGRLQSRVLRLVGTPAERGLAHGLLHAASIRQYTEERVALAVDGSWAGKPTTRADVLALAEEMLPAHRAYAPDLSEEMLAMAAAAGISPAESVIVGGFTDFVDAVRSRTDRATIEEDDCTAVLSADFLAQTWDMHASATPHVLMLDVRDTVPCLVFSTVGCLGQIGMNAAGIAIGINNLVGTDGRVGVTWPFVVRKVLQQTTLEAALSCIVDAPLAGAHDYLLLDSTGAGYNVEAMPTHQAITRLASTPLVHTNHCLDAGTLQRQAERTPALMASSQERLARASLLSRGPLDLDTLVALTRDPGVYRRSQPPYHVETSGAVVMRPKSRELWAVWGVPADHEYESFSVGSSDWNSA